MSNAFVVNDYSPVSVGILHDVLTSLGRKNYRFVFVLSFYIEAIIF